MRRERLRINREKASQKSRKGRMGVGILKLEQRTGQKREERDHNGKRSQGRGAALLRKELENEGQ